jgi:hypothetical protein
MLAPRVADYVFRLFFIVEGVWHLKNTLPVEVLLVK